MIRRLKEIWGLILGILFLVMMPWTRMVILIAFTVLILIDIFRGYKVERISIPRIQRIVNNLKDKYGIQEDIKVEMMSKEFIKANPDIVIETINEDGKYIFKVQMRRSLFETTFKISHDIKIINNIITSLLLIKYNNEIERDDIIKLANEESMNSLIDIIFVDKIFK